MLLKTPLLWHGRNKDVFFMPSKKNQGLEIPVLWENSSSLLKNMVNLLDF